MPNSTAVKNRASGSRNPRNVGRRKTRETERGDKPVCVRSYVRTCTRWSNVCWRFVALAVPHVSKCVEGRLCFCYSAAHALSRTSLFLQKSKCFHTLDLKRSLKISRLTGSSLPPAMLHYTDVFLRLPLLVHCQ